MDALSRLVSTFFFNSLWQVALVAMAAMGADLLLRRGPAWHRHVLWVSCLGAAIMLPVVSLRTQIQELSKASATAISADLLPETEIQTATPSLHISQNSAQSWLGKLSLPGNHWTLSLPGAVARAILALYFLSIAVMLARLGRAWIRTREIRRLAQPLDAPAPHIVQALDHCRCRLRQGSRKWNASPSLFSSRQIPGPVTVGVRRPAIILPAALLDPSARQDLTAALAHEMGHISRCDYLWNLIYQVLYLPIAFHPLASLILRRIGDTRELACDELAARLVNTSDYARSLVRMAQDMSRRDRAAPAPNYTLGVFDANILEERVMRLLKPRAGAYPAKILLASAGLLLASLSFAAVRFSVGVAPASASAAAAQRSQTDQNASRFAGTWTAKFEGKTYLLLNLGIKGGKLAGTISTGDVNIDAAGQVNEVTGAPRGAAAILDAGFDGGKAYFKQKDGSDTVDYKMEVDDTGHGSLRVVNSGGVRMQPFQLARETNPPAFKYQAAVRPAAYATARGGSGEGVSGGVAGGVSGRVAGGVSGGVAGGVSKPSATAGRETGPQNGSEGKTGSLSGIVVDASGARIPNAEIRLISRNNSFQKSMPSDDSGNFNFDDVPTGRYSLEVSSPGMGGTFRSFDFKAEGQPPFFPFVLHPGSVAETVAVTAKSPHALGDKATKMGPRRIRIGGSVEAAKLVEGAQPGYPESAKSRGVQGIVVLEATIAADGTIEDLKVVSSPDDDLTKAAVGAVREWRYQPTLLNGDPVEVVTTVQVNFTLQD